MVQTFRAGSDPVKDAHPPQTGCFLAAERAPYRSSGTSCRGADPLRLQAYRRRPSAVTLEGDRLILVAKATKWLRVTCVVGRGRSQRRKRVRMEIGRKNENAGNLAVSGVFRVPHSLSVQTPSSVDPTMNLQPQRFFSVFPLSSQCYFKPWFGSCIPARPSMKSPHFDFPLHLLLDRRRFCRHPSATSSSTEAVDAVSALGRPPHLLPGSRSRFRLRSALPSPL